MTTNKEMIKKSDSKFIRIRAGKFQGESRSIKNALSFTCKATKATVLFYCFRKKIINLALRDFWELLLVKYMIYGIILLLVLTYSKL